MNLLNPKSDELLNVASVLYFLFAYVLGLGKVPESDSSLPSCCFLPQVMNNTIHHNIYYFLTTWFFV